MAHQHRTRGNRAGVRTAARLGAAGARGGCSHGRRVRGRRSAALARGTGLRARGQRDSGLGRAAASDGARRRGYGCRASDQPSADPRTRYGRRTPGMTDGGARAVSRAALDMAAAAQLACLLEVSAPKPGNVSPGRRFDDIGYEDFLASAAAIGGPLASAGDRPLGATIRLAVEATAAWTTSNTNLGIILLLAPLVRAAALEPTSPGSATSWRDSLRRVLDATTVGDARDRKSVV